MNSKYYEFQGTLIPVEDQDATYIIFPYDIRQEFGKGRVKVKATFDGQPYQGSFVNMGVTDSQGNPCYIIGVRKDIRKKIGKQAGDQVFVTIEERE